MNTATKERGILMHGRSVNGILADRKTQTRRIIKPQPGVIETDKGGHVCWGWRGDKKPLGNLRGSALGEIGWWVAWWDTDTNPLLLRDYCPYGQPGDRLWVRETFALESNFNVDSNDRYPPPFTDGRPVRWVDDDHFGNYWQQPHYRATDPEPELDIGGDDPGVRWKPSIHMPRWASRITLEITDVRVERVQDISEADAEAEGVDSMRRTDTLPCFTPPDTTTARSLFAMLWDDTNGKGAWDRNDWVWVICFRRVEA